MTQNTSAAVMQQRGTAVADALDDFPTPPWATRALFHHVILPKPGIAHPCSLTAWEPACNRGHMVKVLREYCAEVIASDVADYGGNYLCDFLIPGTEPPSVILSPHGANLIITNPPFVQAERFVLRSFNVRGRVLTAMLVRTSFLEGGARYKNLFGAYPPTFVAQFSERVIMLKGVLRDPDKRYWDGTNWRRPSTATSYCWLVWVNGMAPQSFIHIPPCRKILTRPGDYPANPDEEGVFTPPQEGMLNGNSELEGEGSTKGSAVPDGDHAVHAGGDRAVASASVSAPDQDQCEGSGAG